MSAAAAQEREFFTSRDLAVRWGMAEKTVRNMLRRREVPSYKLGGARRVAVQDVLSFEAASREER